MEGVFRMAKAVNRNQPHRKNTGNKISRIATSMSPRLNILCTNFKIREFFIKITTLFNQPFMYEGCYFTHMRDRIILLRDEAWAHKTSLTTLLYTEAKKVSVMYICLLGVSNLTLFQRFFYWILELFQHCGIFCSSFKYRNCRENVYIT